MPRVTRAPSHASSWYIGDAAGLSRSIDGWLEAAEGPSEVDAGARAIIAPHAGYSYCGHVMAYAYKYLVPSTIKRIFLLGPSHHFYSKRCLLSTASAYNTPLGPLEIDADVYAQLTATGKFDSCDLDADEAEHSLELHTPYIARVMQGHAFKLVPIIVGSLSTESEAAYGAVLGPYLDDPSNAFVISSDFCHWGRRFSFTTHFEDKGPIWKSIQWLDEEGIKAIETGEPAPFADYLAVHRNTICGRHPIGVLLNMLKHAKARHSVQFKKYDQSSKCEGPGDSSVSYAAAVVSVTP
ncbi:hypothetical protein FOA52_009832 [Chlamydomonas sp. UWO 241]|nr:hypothetical protein FOA52_009832 [Chlamydomonas sp. UWO 241]